jgi:predicted metal-dependent HD superfamily phosphohydrolase
VDPAVEDRLRRRWARALPDAPPAGAAAAFDALAARHREPHRHYHTLAHVADVVGWVDRLAGEAEDPEAVVLAGFLHDVVYDPASADNEEASAGEAERVLTPLGLAPARVAEVARLVRATAGHVAPPGDGNAAVLADADLAILGAEPACYRAYVAAVRAEYAHVDDDAWRAGRSALLAGFLARPRLYVTDAAGRALEAPARENLVAELTALSGPASR